MKNKRYLKTDLHLHTCDGVIEKCIPYNAFELIDMGMKNGYEVLSITNHDSVTFSRYLRDYARERGIVLIPGIELTLKRKHVLIYNVVEKLHWIKNFSDLEQLRDKNYFLMAPHPFYPCYKSLGRHLKAWIHVFDAIELSHFYTSAFDFNQNAIQCAQQFGLPIVGTSDSHTLHQMNHTYTLIDAEKDPESIFKAIRDGKIEVITTPLTLTHTGKILFDLILKNHLSKLAAASLRAVAQIAFKIQLLGVAGLFLLSRR